MNYGYWMILILIGCLTFTISCSSEEGGDPQAIDTDGDGLVDANDDCPTQMGPSSNQGCPENVGELVEEENQVGEDDFEKFEGGLGIIINARNIAKKGYVPTIVEITVDANNIDFSQSKEIDPITFMGQLNIPVEGLTDDAVFELREGVKTTVIVKDREGVTIIEQELSAAIFTSNPDPTELNLADLEDTEMISTVTLKENTPYYMQRVNADGEPQNAAARVNRSEGFNRIMTFTSGLAFSGVEAEPDFVFNFIPSPDADEPNTYFIKNLSDGRFFSVVKDLRVNGRVVDAPRLAGSLTTFEQIEDRDDFEFFKFVVRRVSDGVYELLSKPEEEPIKVRSGVGFVLGAGDDFFMRIIATDLEWEAISLGTSFLSPILSAPGTDFGANSTLTNCGTGELSQTIGSDEEITITNTVSWEESFSLTTSISTKVSATVETEVSADFFGASASTKSAVSSEIEASVSATSGVTSFNGAEQQSKEKIFFERTVTVPPGRASLVFDVAQIYDNTKVQFVQRFRLTATDSESGFPLTGEELQSQLQFSRFSGVVTQIGPDFIDITVKGTTILGKVLRTMSEVQDIEASCGG